MNSHIPQDGFFFENMSMKQIVFDFMMLLFKINAKRIKSNA